MGDGWVSGVDAPYTIMTTRAPVVPKTHYQNSSIPDFWEWVENEKCLIPYFGNGSHSNDQGRERNGKKNWTTNILITQLVQQLSILNCRLS